MADITILLTSGTSWVVPSDWSGTNIIRCIGGGGGGGGPIANTTPGRGGGGGGYSEISNLALTPSANITIQIGAGGAAGVAGAGGTGGDTWFNGASLAASS